MNSLWQDRRCGARTLLKQPGFTLTALITLALGIGANTVNFRVGDTSLATRQDSLAETLAVARKSAQAYDRIFRDLTTTETRTTELFARAGKPDGRRVTVADLIVYQSRFDERVIYECRLFRAIDGKPVNTSEKRLQEFFEQAARAKSLKQERELLRDKNKEHFYHFYFYHRTLNPLWMAQPEWTDKLEFALTGRESIAGRDAVIVAFRQKQATPLDERGLVRRQLSDEFKNGRQRWHGRLWVDATNGQLWRVEQERTLEYADTPTPLVVMREVLEFAPSAYGIHVPKRFVADWNFHSWRDKSGIRQLARRVRFTDEYGGFQRFTAEGKTSDSEATRQQSSAAEQAFLKLIEAEGVEKARQVFSAARQRDPRAVLFSEAALNALGYKFLYERKQIETAVAIFQLNVAAYPASANVYDSLAEAYLTQGDKKLADQNYRKSLALNPRNNNAIQMLARMWVRLPQDGWRDRSPHRSEFVTVNGIRLHYLDWGGRGETLLLLTGMSNSAHIFDDLAPQFTDRFRVLALTRRGHGHSDKPQTGYDTDTLVADIAQFLDALKIERAHLAGHSLAGDELTRCAARFPERVGKLVYLDAANHSQELTDQDIYRRIPEVFASLAPSLADVASYQTYRDWTKRNRYGFWSAAQEADFRATNFDAQGELKPALPNYVVNALDQSARQFVPDYDKIKAPALSFHALYAMTTAFPWLPPNADPTVRRKAQEFLQQTLIPHQQKLAERFRREVAGARVRVWPATHHYLFLTRQAAVARAMRKFLLRR